MTFYHFVFLILIVYDPGKIIQYNVYKIDGLRNKGNYIFCGDFKLDSITYLASATKCWENSLPFEPGKERPSVLCDSESKFSEFS